MHLTYKVVTLDIKRKQNNFFLKFFKYWPNSRDFNKLVIKAKMHANTYFWNFLFLYSNTIWFIIIIIIERLGRMHENKTFYFFIFYFLFFIFYMFWRKPGILIPDLYLYNIKIQINIDQNAVKYLQKITSFWKKKLKNFFIIFFSKLGPTRPI
jgi:hypothetical protein